MKRQLENKETHDKINISVQKFNINNEINLLNEILKNDEIKIIIDVDTKIKELTITENINKQKSNKKYKYIDRNLKSLLDIINNDFIYENIISFTLNVNNNNIFANIDKWKNQLLDEILYIKIFEKEKQIENELIDLLTSNLIL